ncbi:hypothetical protein MSNKSG1_09003 [Marinobacter santoriniensis NKSG1]|uniref:Lipopolysaccharide export system protein LptC n=1 Tax=Marinobacter santoriniensis NKSG1 TaxID=1288826 RepID=M7D5K6_9GAMM|nr:LPS export ABC transporter periplasmic protein LptC [Marinobacter santoriniensis]EMP55998.1 hypothetical protein MSNKSG1_09003 [Marinobacter santoriniensis NKSG1]
MIRPLASLLQFSERPVIRTFALAVILAATALLLWRSGDQPVTDTTNAELRGPAEPDGFVVDGRYTEYDQDGNLDVRFSSPRIEQFEEGNLTTIEAPEAELFGDPDTLPWKVKAEHGSLLQDSNLLYLTGNVKVNRQIGQRTATLETTKLTLDNDQNIIYTDAPVTITDNVGVTRSKGMKAWINDRILELNSQVEGRYETAR